MPEPPDDDRPLAPPVLKRRKGHLILAHSSVPKSANAAEHPNAPLYEFGGVLYPFPLPGPCPVPSWNDVGGGAYWWKISELLGPVSVVEPRPGVWCACADGGKILGHGLNRQIYWFSRPTSAVSAITLYEAFIEQGGPNPFVLLDVL